MLIPGQWLLPAKREESWFIDNCEYNARHFLAVLQFLFSYTKLYCYIFPVFQRRRVLAYTADLKEDIRRVFRDVWSDVITVGMVNITVFLVTDTMSKLFV